MVNNKTGELSSMSFSIEETSEYGTGDQELLQTLSEDDIESEGLKPIVQTVTETTSKNVQQQEPKSTTETTTIDPSAEIISFLGEEEEEEESISSTNSTTTDESTVSLGEEGDENSEGFRFNALANDLFKAGVFNREEGEEDSPIETAEAFLERFNLEKKKGASEMIDNFLNQFGEEYRQAFEAIFVNGVKPKDYFGTYDEVLSFETLDMSIEGNQERVVRAGLQKQGFDPEDINDEVERLKSYGDLEETSKRHHKVLIKAEKQKLDQITRESQAKNDQKVAIRNQYINNVQSVLQEKLKSKEFDGIPINSKIANELQDFLLVDRYKTSSGELLTEFDRAILDLKKPENHPMKVKLALLLKTMETDPTLSSIVKVGKSKQVDALFSEVARHTSKPSVTNQNKTSNNASKAKSWFQ